MTSKFPPGLWRRLFRQVHWISAALCLSSLVFYACTGFLLNHADDLKIKAQSSHAEFPLSKPLQSQLTKLDDGALIPAQTALALGTLTGLDFRYATARVADGQVSVISPQPGVKASLSVNFQRHSLSFDRMDRGPIAVLTDLHKGKGVGPKWHLMMDLFAIAVVLFATTGFGLLCVYAQNRRITWPLISLGLLVPILMFFVFLHA